MNVNRDGSSNGLDNLDPLSSDGTQDENDGTTRHPILFAKTSVDALDEVFSESRNTSQRLVSEAIKIFDDSIDTLKDITKLSEVELMLRDNDTDNESNFVVADKLRASVQKIAAAGASIENEEVEFILKAADLVETFAENIQAVSESKAAVSCTATPGDEGKKVWSSAESDYRQAITHVSAINTDLNIEIKDFSRLFSVAESR